jgi:hypothetical protein
MIDNYAHFEVVRIDACSHGVLWVDENVQEAAILRTFPI